LNRIFQYLAIK